MTKGIKGREPNGRDIYPDIIDHPHWQSPTRPHMSLYDRAAQFSSFDALTGYSDMVKEEQRETDRQIFLGGYEQDLLNQKISLIADVIRDGIYPSVSISYFIPDDRKSGGRYMTLTDRVRKINMVNRTVELDKKTDMTGSIVAIEMDRIINISGELVDYLDIAMD